MSAPPDAPRPSEPPALTADVARRRSRGVWLTSFVTMGMLGAAGWELTDRHITQRGDQALADAWLGLRTCMLGPRSDRSVTPAERVRLTQLLQRHQDAEQAWPARCRPQAEAFDAVRVRRSVQERFGALPAALPIVETPEKHHDELMVLVAALDDAGLPLASPGAGDVPPPPDVPHPQLEGTRLTPVGRTGALAEVGVWLDEDRKGGRLLLRHGDDLQLCQLDGAWTSLTCQTSPLPVGAAAGRVRLTVSDGAVSLLRAEDGPEPGFYDGATGGMLYSTPYFGAQANAEGGLVRVLSAKTDGPRGTVKHHQWVELASGRSPRSRRLRAVPRTARTLLVGAHVFWLEHETGGDIMRGLPLRAAEKRRKKKDPELPVLATLPPKSRPVARCEAPGELRLLFTNGLDERQYTLVRFPRRSDAAPTEVSALDLGLINGVPDMQCLGETTELSHVRMGQLTRWRCKDERCARELTDALPEDHDGTHVALGSFGETMAMLWQQDGDALRLRVGPPDTLDERVDRLVYDSPSHGGFEAIDLRVISGRGRALALLQDPSMQVYAMRIDDDGTITPLK